MSTKANYAVSEVTLPTTASSLNYTPPDGFTRDNSIPVSAIVQHKTNNGWYNANESVIILNYTGRIDINESGLTSYGGQPCKVV